MNKREITKIEWVLGRPEYEDRLKRLGFTDMEDLIHLYKIAIEIEKVQLGISIEKYLGRLNTNQMIKELCRGCNLKFLCSKCGYDECFQF